MGNVISRCAQNVRKAWKRCSKKHGEEEAMLSTCESEPLDRCHEHLVDPSISGVDRTSPTGSPTSVHRFEEKMGEVSCQRLSSTPTPGRDFFSLLHHSKECQTLVSTNYDDVDDNGGKRHSALVNQESQTNFEKMCDMCKTASPEPRVLSKAYIVKTYSIQNATPSPAAETKFPAGNHLVRTQQCQPFSAGSALSTSPLATLEKRQEDVLKRLEDLQASVSKLAQKYSVSVADKLCDTSAAALSATTASVTTSSATTAGSVQAQTLQGSLLGERTSACDLVISVDPSKLPLSLIVLCEDLSDRHRVFKSTFIHSSISDSVPDKLRNLLNSNNGIKRGDCDLAVTLIWKNVSDGPHLIVDPTKQTPIQGEANVARYLTRLLNPSHDEVDIVTATQIDELLDLAQLQLFEGNSKEKAAAVRTLNSALGKKDWLVGSEPGVADIVCWSALHQTNQVSNPPANVKRWLNLCGQHKIFKTASSLVS